MLKFKVVREVQPLNILFIVSTLLVSKLLKFKVVREVQPLNILLIVSTLLVLNPDTSMFFNAEQLWNIELIFV